MKEVVMVFLKNPEYGKVKTRLARDIGEEEALSVYNNLARYTLDIVKKVNARIQLWFSSYLPGHAEGLLGSFEQHLQKGEDLGERLSNAFGAAFEEGAEKVLVIGSDCPELRHTHLEEALELLNEKELVIGPSEDGGYYLLGLNACRPGLFEGIAWSSSSVFTDTINKAMEMGLRVHVLEILNDIDTVQDLRKYRKANPGSSL